MVWARQETIQSAISKELYYKSLSCIQLYLLDRWDGSRIHQPQRGPPGDTDKKERLKGRLRAIPLPPYFPLNF